MNNSSNAGGGNAPAFVRVSHFQGENEGKLKENYMIGKIMGHGSFGEVRLGIHK